MKTQIQELDSLNKYLSSCKKTEYEDIIKQWNEYYKNLGWYQKNVDNTTLLKAKRLAELIKSNTPHDQITSVFGVELKPFMPKVASAVQEKLKLPSTGLSAVARWQRIIGVNPDGQFGPATTAATKSWQSSHGLTADGIVGPKSWTKAGVNPPLETIRQAGSTSSSSIKPTQPSVYNAPPSTQTSSSMIPSLAGWPLWAGLGLVGAFVFAIVKGQKVGHSKFQDERWDENEISK